MEKAQITDFFRPEPRALPLFEAACDRIFWGFPGATMRVQKTQITFDDPHGFAYIWLPPRKIAGRPEVYIVLSFVLPHQVEHERIAQATFVRADRITHHVLLDAKNGIDPQIMAWLKEAHALMRGMRHKK